jgi:hypothetical protein
MSRQRGEADQRAPESGKTDRTAGAANNQENQLEAEQESAAAMDADVPQPPDADKTTEGQPS